MSRAAIDLLHDKIDTQAATEAWEEALAAPQWSGPPVWIHGDLMPGNLLVDQGRLSAVIDFGGLGVGDPACDLQIAWNLFTGDSEAYRAAVANRRATWIHGRGWALSVALLQLPYYETSNPAMAGIARSTINAVLADHTALIATPRGRRPPHASGRCGRRSRTRRRRRPNFEVPATCSGNSSHSGAVARVTCPTSLVSSCSFSAARATGRSGCG